MYQMIYKMVSTATLRSIAGSIASISLVLLACNATAAEVKSIDVQRDGGRIDIQSEFVINAPLPEVYAALINYDQFAEMGDTFADSRYVEPAADGTPRIYTRIEGCIWFFCKTIERYARIEVESQRKIRAIAEPENSDAQFSIESWTLTAAGDSTIIEYRHELEAGFWVPPMLGNMAIHRSVETATRKAVVTIENLATAGRKIIVAQN